VLYHPGIVVLHNDWALSLDRFCERQKLYSISDVLLWRKYGGASPRALLVRENSPVDWEADDLPMIAKKSMKRVLAVRSAKYLVRMACKLSERLLPDSHWNHRAYDLAVAIAIFEGVRQGLSRYAAQ